MRKDIYHKRRWEKHQQSQIHKFVHTELELQAVFPGSMLFNQILVPTEEAVSLRHFPVCTPESVNVVYEYCSNIHSDSELNHSILIDTGELDSIDSVDGIVKVIENYSAISQLVFVGQSARHALIGLLESRLTRKMKVTVVEPDWDSIYSLYKFYRQAHHVIFVDTMRVLDAAYTRCDCSMVATNDFRSGPTFDVLQYYLDTLSCPVFDQRGSPLCQSGVGIELPFMIVENKRSNLTRVLAAAQPGDDHPTDWLDDMLDADNTPVIDRRRDALNHSLGSMRDRKTRYSRKLAKLRNDPLTFMVDSNFRILRWVAHVAFSRNG